MRVHIINFKGRCQKGLASQNLKSNVLREFVMTLLASTRFFHKKEIKWIFDFVWFDVLFVDVRLILDNCRTQVLSLEDWLNLFNFFILQLMVVMSLETNFFKKKSFTFCILHMATYYHIGVQRRCYWTYSAGQSMALRLPKHFLASFNWILVFCLFVVLFLTA